MISLKGIDKSIIDYFDKTPEGIVCPHFWELKWANGCNYKCAWCYLQGTFRYPQYKKHGSHILPVIKDKSRVEKALKAFLERARALPDENFLLNSGELSDSMITSGDYTLPELITGIESWPENMKVLFLTKSDRTPDIFGTSRLWSVKGTNKGIKELNKILKERSIMSWSLNAYNVAERWEKGAPTPLDRIEVAHHWKYYGFQIRFRIDPIVPVNHWQHKYFSLIDDIFQHFMPDEIDRITLGTLRGLQSTINAAEDTSWTESLSEKTSWGLKMPEPLRADIYSRIIAYLYTEHGYDHVALCKETEQLWKNLNSWAETINKRGIMPCNCEW